LPWEAIKYVSGGFTLCAFFVAALLSYLKNRTQEERKRIETARPEDRADLVAKTLEFFNVDTRGLTREQQFQLAMRQINGRIERFRLVAIVVVVLAIIGAGLSAYAITVQKQIPDLTAPKKPDDDVHPNPPAPNGSTDKVPPLVKGGAAIGTSFQYTFTKNGSQCVNETAKVSPTEWQERPVTGSAAGCLVDAVIFEFTERESKDPRYILLYDEGRNLLARFGNVEKGQSTPSEWRLVSESKWNEVRAVTRAN
jgi:type II secretory pathway pseudopilin PulG